MRATVIHGAGDVRIEDVPDATVREPTDALVRVLRACICGSDLWPYASMDADERGARIGHEFIGVIEDLGADVSGFAKVLWVIAFVLFSYLGVFAYLLTQGRGMAERNRAQANEAREELRHIVGFSAADEIVRWTGGGWLCPADVDERGYTKVSPTVMAQELEKGVRSPDYLRKLGAAGRQAWLDRFTWAKIAKSYERILRGETVVSPMRPDTVEGTVGG